jgi:hypothetical protein
MEAIKPTVTKHDDIMGYDRMDHQLALSKMEDLTGII